MTEEKTIDIGDLIQDSKNFNRGTDEGQQLMERSFGELGAGRSILIDRHGQIIAGNKSQRAAQAAGITKVRVIETDGKELIAVKRTDVDLDSAEGRRMALLDNLTTQVNLSWDESQIQAVTEEVEGFSVPDFGFDPQNMPTVSFPDAAQTDGEGESDSQPEAKEDDFDPDAHYETKVNKGDIWQLGNHRLMCGDSTSSEDVARLMDGEKARLVITDPPYNVAVGSRNKVLNQMTSGHRIEEDIENDSGMTDEEVGNKIWKPAFINMKANADDDCTIYVSMPQGGTHMMMMMMMMHDAGWQIKHELIWIKNVPTFSMGRLNYDYQHEPILFGWNKTHKWYGAEHKVSTLYFDRPMKSDLHPTMKPITLWAELINNSSRPGDIVLDTFGGSGTTIVACEQLQRKARLVELDPHYCDVIIARWEKLTGQKATKIV